MKKSPTIYRRRRTPTITYHSRPTIVYSNDEYPEEMTTYYPSVRYTKKEVFGIFIFTVVLCLVGFIIRIIFPPVPENTTIIRSEPDIIIEEESPSIVYY